MSTPDPKAAVAIISQLSHLRPTLALVLGSGFNHVLSELKVDAAIACANLPGFPRPGVMGHEGKLLVGRFDSTPVMVLSGRTHFYEGHSMDRVTFAVRTLAAYGIRDLLLTNAAGGMNRKFRAGNFMVVTDHINFMGMNPLRGSDNSSRHFGVSRTKPPRSRFVDLTEVYDATLRRRLETAARKARVKLQRGVYLAVSGPSYETPAEIRAFARLGADAVGMSTVPEAIVARQCEMRVAALSCITNLAAGISKSPISHEDVLETGHRVRLAGARLLKEFCRLHK